MDDERNTRGALPEESNPRRNIPAPRPERKKRRGRWKIVLLALVVLAVLFALCVRLFPNTFNLDRLGRTFRYMGLRDKSGYGQIHYDAAVATAFSAFDDGLLVAGENSVTLYSLNGEQKAFAQGALPTPILVCSPDVSLCFSPGSSYAAAIGSGGDLLMDQAASGPVLDADVSTDGYVGMITSESGYKSIATVYNQNQDAVFRFSSRTRYLSACAVSEKGSRLALAALAEEEAGFRTVITVLDTGVELTDLEQAQDEVPQADLGNRYVYDLVFLGSDRICAVCQDALVFLDAEGNLLNTVTLEDSQLLDCSFGDRDGVVLALGRNAAGESGRIVILDADGDVKSEQEVRERIRSVSAAGKYVAVLTDSCLEILDHSLNSYDKTAATYAASRVAARPDGTAFLIGSNSAVLYIP